MVQGPTSVTEMLIQPGIVRLKVEEVWLGHFTEKDAEDVQQAWNQPWIFSWSKRDPSFPTPPTPPHLLHLPLLLYFTYPPWTIHVNNVPPWTSCTTLDLKGEGENKTREHQQTSRFDAQSQHPGNIVVVQHAVLCKNRSRVSMSGLGWFSLLWEIITL